MKKRITAAAVAVAMWGLEKRHKVSQSLEPLKSQTKNAQSKRFTVSLSLSLLARVVAAL